MSGSNFSRSSQAESSAAGPGGRQLIWPWLALLLVVAMVAAYVLLRPPWREVAGEKHAAVGTRIEELRLEPLTGGAAPVTLADLQGKITLINFWGPWCPPCRVEFPHLMEIEQHFRGNDRFRFLSISCSGGRTSGEEIGLMTAEFLEERGATFPTYRDPFQRFAQHLLAVANLPGFAWPTSLVLDEAGVIRGMWVGYVPGDEREIHRLLERLLRPGP